MDLNEAAEALRRDLKPILGNLVKVEYHPDTHRGIKVKFEREEEEVLLKRQISTGYREGGEYVALSVSVMPSGGNFELKQTDDNRMKDRLKSLGVSFRRASVPTLEKAVETLVKWFKANASKLKEGTPKTASDLVLRVASRF